MDNCEFDTSNLAVVLHQEIESRRGEVEKAVERIMEIVRKMPCACDSLVETRLALEEALANAVIHGNQEDASKKVEICEACENQERLLVIVTDEGQGFDPARIPDPTVAENIFWSHGRGVFLISRLMDQVEYRQGGRQVLHRKKRV